jgi:hypothetical protein
MLYLLKRPCLNPDVVLSTFLEEYGQEGDPLLVNYYKGSPPLLVVDRPLRSCTTP